MVSGGSSCLELERDPGDARQRKRSPGEEVAEDVGGGKDKGHSEILEQVGAGARNVDWSFSSSEIAGKKVRGSNHQQYQLGGGELGMMSP